MRHFVSVLSVVVLIAAMLVAMAAPALAQAVPVEPGFTPPPNCEEGQDQAWAAHPNGPLEAKHMDKYVDCLNSRPPGEGQGSV